MRRDAPAVVPVNLPNLISLARLLSVPVGIWLLVNGSYTYAFWLFVGAAISDAVDGFIAKRFALSSELGAYLDPIADKALLVSVYVTIGLQGHVAAWLLILVVFRDVLIVGGWVLLQFLGQPMKMQPNWSSKLNTAAQIALAALVLAGLGLEFGVDGFVEVTVWVVAATTVWSGAQYVIQGFKWVNGAAGSTAGSES